MKALLSAAFGRFTTPDKLLTTAVLTSPNSLAGFAKASGKRRFGLVSYVNRIGDTDPYIEALVARCVQHSFRKSNVSRDQAPVNVPGSPCAWGPASYTSRIEVAEHINRRFRASAYV